VHAGLLREIDGLKVGLLRPTDKLAKSTLEKMNAVKAMIPDFTIV
jgi:hypothetical protein